MKTHTGELPAYPVVEPLQVQRTAVGLTKREYAAIHIIAGIQASDTEGVMADVKATAVFAVKQTDALFAELEKK